MKGWWVGMDLAPWCVDGQQGASGFGFALAIANERARVRGVRQRVTRNHSFKVSPFAWLIDDLVQPRLREVAS